MSTGERQFGDVFRKTFGRRAEVSADAPGRVNLIGEHTDYHEGLVLPTVIPQRTRVQLARRLDARVCAWSAALSASHSEYQIGQEAPTGGWLDYVQGITALLAARGHYVPGFDICIESTVPVGAGVSSSAALEVSLLRALRSLLTLPIDDVELARIAQAAEVEFVGAPVGIMDQMVCSLAGRDEALYIDTRTLASDRIRIPDALDLIVIDSGGTHRHAGGEYATRRRESFEAAAALGIAFLRDVEIEALPRLATLPTLLRRRARHVITENDRVRRAATALRAGDLVELGRLIDASHASMRDDYEVSTEAIDRLVDIGRAHPAVYGARLTGGGFGGSVVILAAAGSAASAAHKITRDYRDATGAHGRILVPETTPGLNA